MRSFYLYNNMHCDVERLFSFFINALWFTRNYRPSSIIKCHSQQYSGCIESYAWITVKSMFTIY